MSSCLNCGNNFTENSKYCTQCGQKTSIRIVSFWNIVKDFFSNFFNIDAKIWQTLRDIWVPAKLTIAYIEGRRVKYYNPIRIFIVVLFAFFALLIYYHQNSFSEIEEFTAKQHKKYWLEQQKMQFDSLVSLEAISPNKLSNLRKSLFGYTSELDEYFHEVIDSTLEANPDIPPELFYQIIDSLRFVEVESDNVVDAIGNFKHGAPRPEIVLGEGVILPGIRTKDLFKLSPKQLESKFSNEPWYKRVLVLQLQKIVTNLSSSIKFFLGNGTWATLAVILFMSMFYKILYFKQIICLLSILSFTHMDIQDY